MSLMDIPLQFHEFQHLDHLDRCPNYTKCLQKLDSSISAHDLDGLYTDLEILQGASNIRLRRLEEEVKILTEWCDKKDRTKGDVDLEFLSNVTAGTSSSTAEEPVCIKKQRLDEPIKAGSSNTLKIKSKVTAENVETEVHVVPKPKLTYDTSNKFWGYVEPYCADITLDDIRTLEESLSVKTDTNDYFKIPPLGKHYSELWAKEDLIEEQQQSSKVDRKRSNATFDGNSSCFVNTDSITMQGESEENCPYGKFTKMLIAALVDENIMAPMSENEILESSSNEGQYKSESKNNLKRSTGPAHTKSLENAIKDELFSLGLIESTDDGDEQDDEILLELRRCQNELRSLRTHNKASINKLISLAKNTIKNQEVRQKAKVLDAEVQDVFRRFSAAKAKKKGLSRKDREFAWKAIRDREAVWKLVDSSECEKQE